MNVSKEHEELAGRAKARFDESVERLDGATLSRLNRARHAALANRRERPVLAGRGLLPVTACAAAAVAVALLVRTPEPATLPLTGSAEQDAEFLFGEDNLEMFENLEFYFWMEEFNGATAINLG